LEEIFKKMKIFKEKRKKGVILIVAFLTLGILLLLGVYFLSFTLTDSRISKSQVSATQTYYLAEAGVNEAIWKLKNDSIWKNNFETNPDWESEVVTRDPALFPGGSYQFKVENFDNAYGEITSTAKLLLSEGKFAQRIVKTKVFKAQGSPLSDYNILAGGPSENIYISSTSPLNIHNGSIFANNNINIKYGSVVNVDSKALAGNNINVSGNSQLNAAQGRCSKNYCTIENCTESPEQCPPASVSMPPIDFDSISPSSYLNLAKSSDCSLIRTDGKTNCVFTLQEFEDLMWSNQDLTLPSDTVTYITGDINIRADQILRVDGVLVADRDLNIGDDLCWTSKNPPYLRCGSSQLIITRPGTPEDDKPAGLLVKRKINSSEWVASLNITGLIYAGDEMKLISLGAAVEIHGGIAVRKFTLSSLWQGVNIYLDSDVVADTFKQPIYSPVITVEHWEESY